jgi:hypothetical protein
MKYANAPPRAIENPRRRIAFLILRAAKEVKIDLKLVGDLSPAK